MNVTLVVKARPRMGINRAISTKHDKRDIKESIKWQVVGLKNGGAKAKAIKGDITGSSSLNLC